MHFCSTHCRETYLKRSNADAPSSLSLPSSNESTPIKTSIVASAGNDETNTESTASKPSFAPPAHKGASLSLFRLPYVQLWMPFFIESVILSVLLLTLLLLPPHYQEGVAGAMMCGAGILLSIVLGIVREWKNGIGGIVNTLPVSLAATAIAVASYLYPTLWYGYCVALSVPGLRALGRCAEFWVRYRSGVLQVIVGVDEFELSKKWRDNSALAILVRKISIALDLGRIPVGVVVGVGIFFGLKFSASFALLGAAMAVIVFEPRLLRMVTGDAHLKVALQAARNGIGVRDADAVARLGDAKRILLMAREALVMSKVEVVDWFVREGVNEENIKQALYSLENAYDDRYSDAVGLFLQSTKSPERIDKKDIHRVPGKGIYGKTSFGVLHCGSRNLMLENSISTAELEHRANELERTGRRALFVALCGEVVAMFGIEETFVPDAKEAVMELSMSGYEPSMMTSAEVEAAQSLGERLGISHVKFERPHALLEDVIKGFNQSGDDLVLIGGGGDFEQSLRSAACAIAVGPKVSSGSLAGIDARAKSLLDIAQLLMWVTAARRSVYINLLSAALFMALGMCFVFGWITMQMILALSIGSVLLSFLGTLSGPYPLWAKTIASVRNGLGAILRLVGVAKRK